MDESFLKAEFLHLFVCNTYKPYYASNLCNIYGIASVCIYIFVKLILSVKLQKIHPTKITTYNYGMLHVLHRHNFWECLNVSIVTIVYCYYRHL